MKNASICHDNKHFATATASAAAADPAAFHIEDRGDECRIQ